ncbi:putative Transposon TX1 [Gossypium australe]|uniref:Putative Transposon TX1 n=1 Tax=Gossypium australe TaxID=47621 RepID=A0A5B6VWJ5_9ROSI|nr:putative Transposon TX1 [Gossypium australe]
MEFLPRDATRSPFQKDVARESKVLKMQWKEAKSDNFRTIWGSGVPLLSSIGGIFERLDKARNSAWVNVFPNYSSTHIPILKFDHKPLLLSIRSKVNIPMGRPFRFERRLKMFFIMKNYYGSKKLGVRLYGECLGQMPKLLWDLVGDAVCDWIQKVFAGNVIDPELNNLLVVLIPKVFDPEIYAQFRSISLCSVLYKLVIKVIANWYKTVFLNIITSEQDEFITGKK